MEAPIKVALIASTLIFAACRQSTEAPTPAIPEFLGLVDINQAPEQIQSAARAVVMLETGDAHGGTASFVNESGLLMTNNHVLGTDNCSQTGCYATLTFGFQRGQDLRSEDFFLRPVTISPASDFSIYQTYKLQDNQPTEEKLSTPDHLEFSETEPEDLVGAQVFTVGHPSLGLKKFSAGQVKSSNDLLLQSDAFTLPGNSGSPVLSADGKIVGIHHHGVRDNGQLTRSGLEFEATETTAKAIREQMASANPSETGLGLMQSNDQVIDQAKVFDSLSRLMNSRVTKVRVQSSQNDQIVPKEMHPWDAAVEAMETRLAGATRIRYDDSFDLVSQTWQLIYWIRCRDSERTKPHHVCPSGQRAERARNVIKRAYEVHLATTGYRALGLLGEFAYRLSTKSNPAGRNDAMEVIKPLVASTALTFQTARYLVRYSNSNVSSIAFGDQDVIDFVVNYQRFPNFSRDFGQIIAAIEDLYYRNLINEETFKSKMTAIMNDPEVTLNNRINAEVSLKLAEVI